VVVELFSALLPPFVGLDVCFAVPEPVVEPLFVFEAEVEAVLPVVELLLLSFCRTTSESSSGNHRGQGHAAVKVERKSRTSE